MRAASARIRGQGSAQNTRVVPVRQRSVDRAAATRTWKHWRDDADLWLWIVSGMIAVAAGLRFFPHYYLQVIPRALLAGRGLASHAFFTRRTGIALVAVLALVPVASRAPRRVGRAH